MASMMIVMGIDEGDATVDLRCGPWRLCGLPRVYRAGGFECPYPDSYQEEETIWTSG